MKNGHNTLKSLTNTCLTITLFNLPPPKKNYHNFLSANFCERNLTPPPPPSLSNQPSQLYNYNYYTYCQLFIQKNWNHCEKRGLSAKKDLLISIPEATKLLLSGSIPTVEANLSTVCEEIQWVNLHSNGRCLGQAKSRRQNKTIANNDKHVRTNP